MTTTTLNYNTGGGHLAYSFPGISPIQTLNNYKDSTNVMMRRVLVKSWNNPYAMGKVNGKSRVITPFRAVNNSGDFLARQNYVCGGPNQIQKSRAFYQGSIGSIISKCDGSGIPSSTCNVKYVADSSDYTKFKKQRASVQNYNDVSNGGDQNHASYVARLGVHRK